MELTIDITWDPKLNLEDADRLEIEAAIENGTRKTYSGYLRGDKVLSTWLASTLHSAARIEEENIFIKDGNCTMSDYSKTTANPDIDEPGHLQYRCDLANMPRKEELKPWEPSLTDILENRLERLHYIMPRDEWVNDSEMCKYFGSSGGFWPSSRVQYPKANPLEHLQQTIWEMEEEGNMDFDLWSKGLDGFHLRKLKELKPELSSLVDEEILPILRESRKKDSPGRLETYKQIEKILLTNFYQNDN